MVLFARMPNFVSFMYFLLNCITDRQIPYASSSQTNFVSFMYFLLISTTDKWIPFELKSRRNCWKSSWPHKNLKQGRKGNIKFCTFHSLHQEESKTWRSINKEIRTVWVSNFVQPNLYTCVFELAVKLLRVADVIDNKIVMQCLTCWKRLS